MRNWATPWIVAFDQPGFRFAAALELDTPAGRGGPLRLLLIEPRLHSSLALLILCQPVAIESVGEWRSQSQ